MSTSDQLIVCGVLLLVGGIVIGIGAYLEHCRHAVWEAELATPPRTVTPVSVEAFDTLNTVQLESLGWKKLDNGLFLLATSSNG